MDSVSYCALISLPSNMPPYAPVSNPTPLLASMITLVQPVESTSESGCQTDDQVDELASDTEKYEQSDHEQSTPQKHERSPSIKFRQSKHIELVVETTLSDLDAVLQSAADKTDLPAEYFIWKWNAEMAARLVEGKDGGSRGVSLASLSGGGGY